MENVVVWVDVPVKNLERAMEFYSKVLGVKIEEAKGMPRRYAFLPFAPGVASGGLVLDENAVAGKSGPLVYLSAGEDLARPLSRVAAAGGKVLAPKTSLGGNGYMAQFEDTEGNRLALHSRN